MPGFLIFLVSGLLAGIIAIFSHQAEKKREAAGAAVAAEHGLTYTVKSDPPAGTAFGLFGRGRARHAKYVMADTARGGSVFVYFYTTGSGKSRQVHRVTCAMVSLPFSAPETTIGQEGLLSGLSDLLGFGDVEVEWDEFNDRFRIKSTDERFAVTLLDQPTMVWMMSDPAFAEARFELDGPQMLVWMNGVRPFDWMPEMLRWAQQATTKFPSVLSSLYPAGGRR